FVFRVFFFQAEDGIRDGHVTGVQTCALPISWLYEPATGSWQGIMPIPTPRQHVAAAVLIREVCVAGGYASLASALTTFECYSPKIGRASCRERVERSGEAGCV